MKTLGEASARLIATVCGLTVGALTLIQYARVSGMEVLAWLHVYPGPFSTLIRAVLVAATLLVSSVSTRRAFRVIGKQATLRWFGMGSGLFLVLLVIWTTTYEATRPVRVWDTREALQLLAAPIALVGLVVLVFAQVLVTSWYSAGLAGGTSSRGLIAGSALLAVASVVIGIGPFRWHLGEWHYIFALWMGDVACVGFLAASGIESPPATESRRKWIRLAAALIGLGMVLLAVVI